MMVPPTDIPNVGTFAVIQDPQGAVFGVLDTKGRPGGWNGTPVVGRFSWHELMAMDHNKAFEFYKRLFGWEKTGEMDMGGGNTYLMYGKGKPFGGIFTRPPEMASMRPFWLSYIHVKDVKKAVDTATKAGAFVQRPPMPIPGGMIAILGDPQGAAFAVVDASAPSTATQSTTRPARKSASKPRAKTGAKKKAASKTKATKKRRPAGKKRTPAKKTARRAPAAKRRGTKRRVRRSR
jgi:predicted enzyme related to lactoylglutathione lyase